VLNRALCAACHAAWLTTCLPQTLAFARASRSSVRHIQEQVLVEILQRQATTVFGRRHRFDRLHSACEFQATVPPAEYEDLAPYIEAAAAGAPHQLTVEPVHVFEPTSGSTAAFRLIPYTSASQDSFNRALHPWLFDLFTHRPHLATGPAYWVITPRLGVAERTSSGVPIGFVDDAAYFGRFAKALIDRVMVVPSSVGRLKDPREWRLQTLWRLVRAEQLRLISLWSPTFLPVLLRSLPEFAADLQQMLAGEDRDRLDLVNRVIEEIRAGREMGCGTKLWPQLQLISTWTDGDAAAGLPDLQKWFFGVPLQPKGLLATEGVVTIPMCEASAPVLAVRSAFFEFIEGEEGEGSYRLAHELEQGGRYRVLMTTPGGLYRYKLHDVVSVEGWWRRLPMLQFIGKEAHVSDLCGEKLNARHLREILQTLVGSLNGVFVAAETASSPPHYVCLISTDVEAPGASRLRNELEAQLQKNPHYRWCREVGQLNELRVVQIPYDTVEMNRRRLARWESMGTRRGTAKTGVLDRLTGWTGYLTGDTVDSSLAR